MGEQIPKQEGEQGDGASQAGAATAAGSDGSSAGASEGTLDGLLAVGGSGEGAVAIPQTVCTSVLDADTGKSEGESTLFMVFKNA